MATSNKKKKPQQAHTQPAKGKAAEQHEDILDRNEHFLARYGRKMLNVLFIVVIIVAAWMLIKQFYIDPRNEKASAMMFVAEQFYGEGDYEAALNGDGNNAGFLEVMDNYGATRSGRLAAHYAGICYMKTGDMDSALQYLGKYKTAKGATAVIINAQNFGLQGDIYMDRGETRKAADMYRKAVNAANNVLTTPYYLKKSALAQELLGNTAMAIKDCKRISDEYATSYEARDIDKYIGALEQKQ